MLFQLGTLLGGEIDRVAWLDLKWKVEIRLNVIESVALIGHTLGECGEALRRCEGAIA